MRVTEILDRARSISAFVSWVVLSAFVVVFYYDIRVRDEAFDLRVAFDAIERPAMPSPGTLGD